MRLEVERAFRADVRVRGASSLAVTKSSKTQYRIVSVAESAPATPPPKPPAEQFSNDDRLISARPPIDTQSAPPSSALVESTNAHSSKSASPPATATEPPALVPSAVAAQFTNATRDA